MITNAMLFFYLMQVLQNGRFRDDPSSFTLERTRRDFQYILTSHPSLYLVIRAAQCSCLTSIFFLVYFSFD